MPEIAEMTIVLLICGVCSYGGTHVLKGVFANFIGRELDEEDPMWWQAAFRIIPIAIGIAVGHAFAYEYPWDIMIGACGGILSVAVYKRAEALLGSIKPK